MKTIYRKLRDYISEEGSVTTYIFATLTDVDNEFYYDGKIYRPKGRYRKEYDFLLDYYVCGIAPKYEIVCDKIIPYLTITLCREVSEDE